jgi:3-hydroxyacyl-CoA dehydrogenase
MKKIAIVGSGLIGRAWATVFAGHGFDVALYDPSPAAAEAARAHVALNLAELSSLGIIESSAGTIRNAATSIVKSNCAVKRVRRIVSLPPQPSRRPSATTRGLPTR